MRQGGGGEWWWKTSVPIHETAAVLHSPVGAFENCSNTPTEIVAAVRPSEECVTAAVQNSAVSRSVTLSPLYTQ